MIDNQYKFSDITERIIGCAIEVHKHLGPGLLESAYEECLAYELVSSGLRVERQKPLPITYKDIHLDYGYRIDLLVENTEKDLAKFAREFAEKSNEFLSEKDFEKYFHLILSGKNIINSFFDSVMVMDKNEEIKNNRIAILKSLDIQFKKVADIKEIE